MTKSRIVRVALVGVVLVGMAVCTAESYEVRTWTAVSGSTVEAKFVRLNGSAVVLESKTGDHLTIPRARLSSADNAYLDESAPVELLLGDWEGYYVNWGRVSQHPMTVKRTGGRTVAVADLYHGARREDMEGRGLSGPANRYEDSHYIVQQYDVIEADGKLTLKGTRCSVKQEPASYELNWTPDTLAAEWKGDGILVGSLEKDGKESVRFFLAHENVLKRPLPLDLAKGKTHRLTCLYDERYHYRCYVPGSYDPKTPAPLLINDSAGANAQPLSPAMAEKYGWIMIGLSESSNKGPAMRNASNCAAAIFDCRRRFNVDPQRLYFSGLSGGSRRSASRAIEYADGCAGVISIAAGFNYYVSGPWKGRYKYPRTDIPVYFIIGKNDDMCGSEILARLYPAENKAGRPCKLHTHEGGHNWGPKEAHDAAITWLEERSKR